MSEVKALLENGMPHTSVLKNKGDIAGSDARLDNLCEHRGNRRDFLCGVHFIIGR